MPWIRNRSFVANVWGLALDAVIVVFVLGMIARGCAAIYEAASGG